MYQSCQSKKSSSQLFSKFPFFYPFKMPFSSAAVKMLPPHANAHAWLSSERNREKRTRLSQIANTFETEKKLGDFSDDLRPKRQNKKESELEFFTCYVVRLGWISLCSCGCWNKISRGLRFCHAVSGFEVGIFRKTMEMGNASSCKGGLIVCWPIENTRSLSIFCDKLFTHISRVLSAAAGYLRTVAWLQRMRCNCNFHGPTPCRPRYIFLPAISFFKTFSTTSLIFLGSWNGRQISKQVNPYS